MKIKTIRSKMLGGLDAMKGALSGSNTASPLRLMKIETFGSDCVLLSATNGDIHMTSRVFCEVEKDGAAVLDGRKFTAFVGALEEGVANLDFGGRNVKISGGAAQFRLSCGEIADFYTMPTPTEEACVSFEIGDAQLKELFRKTAYAACTDRTRAAICGVRFETEGETLTVCAVDGRSLSMVCTAIADCKPVQFTLPNAAVKELARLVAKRCNPEGETLTVKTDGKTVSVTAELWNFTAKLIDGVYPTWRKVLPTDGGDPCTMDRVRFLDQMRRAQCASEGENNTVEITFIPASVEFRAKCAEYSSETKMDADYAGEKRVLSFNAELIARVLECLDDDRVTVRLFGEGENNILIESDGLPFKAVVVPLRHQ